MRVETVLGTDDVASVLPDQIDNRRGIAGAFFVIEVAAAKTETMADLDTVVATAQKANSNTRSMGEALSSCTVPAKVNPPLVWGLMKWKLVLAFTENPNAKGT